MMEPKTFKEYVARHSINNLMFAEVEKVEGGYAKVVHGFFKTTIWIPGVKIKQTICFLCPNGKNAGPFIPLGPVDLIIGKGGNVEI
jgi:hypothetical protein